jgi:hypothetical protein
MDENHDVGGSTGDLGGKLSAAGWGLFLLWIGIVYLGSISAWVALVGIGAITLGMQVVRKSLGLAPEGFWLVVGVLFVVGGIWDRSGTTLPLFPILLIVVGAAVFLSIFKGRAT